MKAAAIYARDAVAYFIVGGALLLAASIAALAFGAPIAQQLVGYPAGEGIYDAFWHICHQHPTRSFWIFQRPFALCARCTGGYLGLAAALTFAGYAHLQGRVLSRAALAWGCALLLLGVMDGTLTAIGLHDQGNAWRLATGFAGGSGAGLLLAKLLRDKGNNNETRCDDRPAGDGGNGLGGSICGGHDQAEHDR